jgi:hypothetical protein
MLPNSISGSLLHMLVYHAHNIIYYQGLYNGIRINTLVCERSAKCIIDRLRIFVWQWLPVIGQQRAQIFA